MGNAICCMGDKRKNVVTRLKTPTKKVEQVIIDEVEGFKMINEYKVIRRLGSGSFGDVSVVCNTENDELYAMKAAYRKLLTKTQGQLGAEVEILRVLDHPNVIKLYEFIDVPNHPLIYLLLEYAEGGPIITLDSAGVANVTLSPSACRNYLKQIVAGLEYLHNNHVIHRDIKPDNILLTENRETVKLSDFGMGHLFSGEDDTIKMTGGTPMFMAPEMCRDAYVSGMFCDIWALGVTLYCFAFGKVPWKGTANQMGLFAEIQSSKPIDFPNAESKDKQMISLLKRMLERDVVRRITLNELKHSPWLTGQIEPVSDLRELQKEMPCEDNVEYNTMGKAILIVEDVVLVREIQTRLLRSGLDDSTEIHTVTDGDEAVKACQKRRYQLVLMDVHMSRVSGCDATRLIRKYEKEKGLVPCNIVGVTADEREQIANICYQAGMNQITMKPITGKVLRELCTKYGFEVKEAASAGKIFDKGGTKNHAYQENYQKFLEKNDPTYSQENLLSKDEGDEECETEEETKAPVYPIPNHPQKKTQIGGPPTHLAALYANKNNPNANAGQPSDPPAAPVRPGLAGMRTTSQKFTKDDIEAMANHIPKAQAAANTMNAPKPMAEPKAIVDPRQASRQCMQRLNMLYKNKSRVFEKVPVKDCFPWALGIALRELHTRRSECVLTQKDYEGIYNKVVRATGYPDMSRVEQVAQPPDYKEVLRKDLDEYIVSQVCFFVSDIKKTPKKHTGIYALTGAVKGHRDAMEDGCLLAEYLGALHGQNDKTFPQDLLLAIYDGHAGAEAMEFCRHFMGDYLVNSQSYITDPAQALDHCFLKSHHGFLDRAQFSDAGTCATAVLIREKMMWIANCGDGKAVLCREGKPIPLTIEHRPSNPSEKALIEARGGVVLCNDSDKCWRVNGMLSVSRSLGDGPCKDYLGQKPDIVSRKIEEKDEFLVVGSDGLWDFMDDQLVVDFIRTARAEIDEYMEQVAKEGPGSGDEDDEPLDDEQIIVDALIDKALEMGSKDNVAVGIIFMNRPKVPVKMLVDDDEEEAKEKEKAKEVAKEEPKEKAPEEKKEAPEVKEEVSDAKEQAPESGDKDEDGGAPKEEDAGEKEGAPEGEAPQPEKAVADEKRKMSGANSVD